MELSEVPDDHFQQEQIQGTRLGKGFWYSFFKLLNMQLQSPKRYYYMRITFLYKRQILVLHYFDSKNFDDITVKQQLALQNILYV